jgi:hypothetical protein
VVLQHVPSVTDGAWKWVGKWKDSTGKTTTERLNAHLAPTFGERQLPEIRRLLMPE